MGSNTGHTNTQDTVCVSHLQMLDLAVFPDKKTKTKAWNVSPSHSTSGLGAYSCPLEELSFCKLYYCFLTKMLHFNGPFFPLKCSVALKLVIKMLGWCSSLRVLLYRFLAFLESLLRLTKMYKWYNNNVSKLIVLIQQKKIPELGWSLDIFLQKKCFNFYFLWEES